MGHEGNGSALPHTQAASWSINLKVVLLGQRPDAGFRFLSNQRAIIQGSRDRGFGNASQFGNISDGTDRFIAHDILIYATDCIIRAYLGLVKRLITFGAEFGEFLLCREFHELLRKAKRTVRD
jgi:hypothetical protein